MPSCQTAAVLLLAAIGCACSTPSRKAMDNTAIDTYTALARALPQQDAPAPGSQSRRAALQRWQELLADLSADNIRGKVRPVYAEQTFFNDTLKTLTDPDSIETYLLETADMLQYGRVTFEDAVDSGPDTYVRWRMVYRSKTLSRNRDIVTVGMSHLRFDRDGRVVLHQDFWDASRGIFEHVPVIGAGIRMVKKRI